MAYSNLVAEMARKKITIRKIAATMQKSVSKISKNINGSGGDFNIEEAFFIRDTFFPECEIEYLFRREK